MSSANPSSFGRRASSARNASAESSFGAPARASVRSARSSGVRPSRILCTRELGIYLVHIGSDPNQRHVRTRCVALRCARHTQRRQHPLQARRRGPNRVRRRCGALIPCKRAGDYTSPNRSSQGLLGFVAPDRELRKDPNGRKRGRYVAAFLQVVRSGRPIGEEEFRLLSVLAQLSPEHVGTLLGLKGGLKGYTSINHEDVGGSQRHQIATQSVLDDLADLSSLSRSLDSSAPDDRFVYQGADLWRMEKIESRKMTIQEQPDPLRPILVPSGNCPGPVHPVGSISGCRRDERPRGPR